MHGRCTRFTYPVVLYCEKEKQTVPSLGGTSESQTNGRKQGITETGCCWRLQGAEGFAVGWLDTYLTSSVGATVS